MTWRVPLANVEIPEQDVEAVLDCLRSGWLTMGPRTNEFEQRFAAYVGSPHAVAVSSCTAALHLACLAAGLGPGDEAIVAGMTFVSTPNAVRYTGATPVLCEVGGPEDMNIDLADVERRITPRTKAVIAVHFCGYPARVLELRELCDERGLVLIEDAAQAISARVDGTGRQAGTVGDLACFSLFSKNQLPVGEGGLVTSPHEELAAKVRSLRSHAMTSVTWDRHRGYADTYDVVDVGYNYRLDEPRAALALSRMGRLDEQIESRRELARTYRRRLAGLEGLGFVWDDDAVEAGAHFAFPVLLPDEAARDRFRERLQARGVQTTWYPAIHRFSDYREVFGDQSLPNVEAAAERHCALPMGSGFSSEQVEIVIESVQQVLADELGAAA
ncbi:MAG TPA: DegT/DnrJ/EryC1/StrS family aminotransferase [Thermoleophilaceae bacterium]|nr:DegT/DnrJ/EryC1/StrS family aminotransferase [Thermoleophilaceae bacterium]